MHIPILLLYKESSRGIEISRIYPGKEPGYEVKGGGGGGVLECGILYKQSRQGGGCSTVE